MNKYSQIIVLCLFLGRWQLCLSCLEVSLEDMSFKACSRIGSKIFLLSVDIDRDACRRVGQRSNFCYCPYMVDILGVDLQLNY